MKYLYVSFLLVLLTVNLLAQEHQNETPRIDSPKVEFVEVPPSFPGGDDELMKFLGENVKYPYAAKINGIQGTVFTRFTIHEDGTISNIHVVKGVHSLLNNEAIRVIKLMPKWSPGRIDSKAVEVEFNLPIKFTVDNGKKGNLSKNPILKDAEVIVDQEPQLDYEGGLPGFLAKNLKMPLELKLNDTSGTVYIEVVIDTLGEIGYMNVLKGVGFGCEDEVIRLMEISSGKWIPAMKDGRKVKVKRTYPIKFMMKKMVKGHYVEVNSMRSYNRGVEFMNGGNIEDAIVEYTVALTKSPKYIDALYNRGVCYYKVGEMEKACEDWESAKELGDNEVQSLLNEYCK